MVCLVDITGRTNSGSGEGDMEGTGRKREGCGWAGLHERRMKKNKNKIGICLPFVVFADKVKYHI